MSRVLRLGSVIAAFLAMASASGAQTATGQITGIGQRLERRGDAEGQGRRHQPADRPDPRDDDQRPRRLRRSAAPCRRLPRHGGADGLQARRAVRRAAQRRSGPARRPAARCRQRLARRSKCTPIAVALDTASATVGQTITEKQVTELPLNGRNFLQLLFLGAGAVETDGEQGGMRQGVGNAISIMGARPTSNNFMIDGTSNIDTSLGTPAAVLSVDAIQEFKEQTTTYSAEYGFSSNQINIVSKSGTNAFHGTGFGFFRNEKLDARNFFDPARRRQAASSIRSSSGSSSAVRSCCRSTTAATRRSSWSTTKATRIERGFELVLHGARRPTSWRAASRRTIIDPATGQPFPNNTIPQARFSRLAQLALRNGWYPAPNSNAAQGNYQAVRTLPQNPGPVHHSRRSGSRQVRARVRPLHEDDVRQHARPRIVHRHRRPRVRAGHDQLAGLPHLADSAATSSTSSGSGRVDARADQKGIACPQADVDFLQSDRRRSPTFPTRSGSARASAFRDIAGRGGAVNAYTREQPADVGHQQHDDLDHGQPHVQLRVQLPPLVAAARPRQRASSATTPSTSASPATRSPTCCSATTPASASSSRPRSACRARPATRASSTSSTSRRTSRTTGR